MQRDPLGLHHKKMVLRVVAVLVLSLVGLLLSTVGRSPIEANTDKPTQVLIVNSDPTDPAVPLDLALVVRLFAKKRLLEITARVGRHPVFPAELFFSNDVKVNIQLPPGLQLQEGSLSWKGDLKGEQIGEFEAKVRVERDMEGAVDASATGHAPGRIDVDTERFYVQAKGRTIRINLEPFTQVAPHQPGAVRPKQ